MVQLLRDRRADPRRILVEGFALPGLRPEHGEPCQERRQVLVRLGAMLVPQLAPFAVLAIVARRTGTTGLVDPIGRGPSPARRRGSIRCRVSITGCRPGRCRKCGGLTTRRRSDRDGLAASSPFIGARSAGGVEWRPWKVLKPPRSVVVDGLGDSPGRLEPAIATGRVVAEHIVPPIGDRDRAVLHPEGADRLRERLPAGQVVEVSNT